MCELLLACVALRFRWARHAEAQGWWGTFISVQCVPATGFFLVHFVFKPLCVESIAMADFGSCVLSVLCWIYLKNNFQRLMSRLEHWWRAQRSVISIVNCRIPWTNRVLNAYCAFGISLKACLLQRLSLDHTSVYLRCLCAAASRLMHSVDILLVAATMLLSMLCVCFCIVCSNGSILLHS